MLTHLSVRNFAVVEAAEIEFGDGLTVVTGETGAGKSLLVDALLLLSGARADTGMVRAGCERAELAAEFDLSNAPTARTWLTEQALDDDGACRLRRVIAAEGGSRAWINGRSASLTQLSELTATLVEIHGQHEHQALLDRAQQLQMLDAFGGNEEAVAKTRELALRHRDIVARERELSGGDDRSARIDLLRHEVGELERWALPADALAELEAQHKRLANAGKLAEGASGLSELLDGDGEFAAARSVARAHSELEKLAELDPSLQATVDMLDGARIQLGEASDALSRYAQDLDLDPERYAEADAHLTALHDLSRRHHMPAAELHAHVATLRDELHSLEGAGEALAQLAAERKQCFAEYGTAAGALSKRRAAAAKKLGTAVTALMRELGMSGGSFAVDLEPQFSGEPDPQGRERCEFTVSANPGMPLRPLRKVASGGELSRIGLAIEVAALGADGVGTMVFDEVDAGIGGAVAETVGAKLRALGSRCQVLCVTHLAQVAAQGHAHLSVTKMVEGEATCTHIGVLDAKGRSEELARMLGGVEIDRETRAHAKKMLEKAQVS
ncbi:MAG TPA: DNA repair protein RecN [Rhodanobacteraceae bacterium]|jgi:DNA repair protein RecN (Recombination protein N)|nr:DNA repair protein RecN [Rhodanobacteraceae bacterium]